MSVNDEFFWKDPKLSNDNNLEESDEEIDNNEMTDNNWLHNDIIVFNDSFKNNFDENKKIINDNTDGLSQTCSYHGLGTLNEAEIEHLLK